MTIPYANPASFSTGVMAQPQVSIPMLQDPNYWANTISNPGSSINSLASQGLMQQGPGGLTGFLGRIFGSQQGAGSVLGSIGGILGGPQFASGVSTFSDLMGIYTGFKALGLAEDQLDFAKSSFNRNFAASARAYNNELRRQHESRTNAHATRGRSYEGLSNWLKPRAISEGG